MWPEAGEIGDQNRPGPSDRRGGPGRAESAIRTAGPARRWRRRSGDGIPAMAVTMSRKGLSGGVLHHITLRNEDYGRSAHQRDDLGHEAVDGGAGRAHRGETGDDELVDAGRRVSAIVSAICSGEPTTIGRAPCWGSAGLSWMPTSAWQVRRMVEGSRPIFSQWRSSTAFLCASSSGLPQTFHSSAKRAAGEHGPLLVGGRQRDEPTPRGDGDERRGLVEAHVQVERTRRHLPVRRGTRRRGARAPAR